MRLVIVATAVLTACAGSPPIDNSENAAILEFAPPIDSKTRLRSFTSIDAYVLNTAALKISIKPGKRTIGYFCAIYLDGPPPPTITENFGAGKTYVFDCKDEVHAMVHEK